MADARTSLLRALNTLVACTTDADRADAAGRITEALDAYLTAPDQVGEAPDASAALANTRKALGETTAPLSLLSDAQLRDLNTLLPWGAMTADQHGRLLGSPWRHDKRSAVHGLIDGRQRRFSQAHDLTGRHVLELGCFEGIHTLGLILLGARVTAVDGRVENVIKTLARLWAYGRSASVIAWDLEEAPPPHLPAEWDVLHHIGVLYHLSNPVEHLDAVLPRTRGAALLDTHVAAGPEEAKASYEVGGQMFRYRHKREPDAGESPFAGMRDHSKYLLLEDLVERFRHHGFSRVEVVEDRLERKGRRVTIWAFR